GQCERSARIHADEISVEAIPRRVRIIKINTALAIARNHIARFGSCSADDVERAAENENTVVRVAQRSCPGDVSADEISFDAIGSGSSSFNVNTMLVAGNEIARAGHRAADEIARRKENIYAAKTVAEPIRAGCGRADEVSLHDISARAL